METSKVDLSLDDAIRSELRRLAFAEQRCGEIPTWFSEYWCHGLSRGGCGGSSSSHVRVGRTHDGDWRVDARYSTKEWSFSFSSDLNGPGSIARLDSQFIPDSWPSEDHFPSIDWFLATPAVEPKHPNAGPGCELGRYRTGEVPQVGDVVRLWDREGQIGAPHRDGQDGVVSKLSGGVIACVHVGNDCFGPYAARFDLISRAPAPAEQSDREGEEDALTDDSPPPIITGKGYYRTARFDKSGQTCDLAQVAGQFESGDWVGGTSVGPMYWDDYGEVLAGAESEIDEEGCRITGPHVPPTKPVLTITEANRMDGWVYGWTLYRGGETHGRLYGNIILFFGDNACGYMSDVLHINRNGPLVIREEEWPAAVEMVAQFNAAALAGSVAPAAPQ